MSKPKVEIINPRDIRPDAPRLTKPVFDPVAVQRADEALQAMSSSFEEWLEADVVRLQTARLNAERAAWSDASQHGVFAAAHDLKGMGATYGYPLVTEIAASLCRLVETEAGKQATRQSPRLATAHIDAIRAAVRDRITSREHAVGRVLVAALQAEVTRLGVNDD